MARCCYVSRSRIDDSHLLFQTRIRDILNACARNNGPAGLSGVLIHEGGHFVQLLEGPCEALDTVMGAIRADDRHTDLADLIETEDCAERFFPSWSMAFVNADAAASAPPRPHWREVEREALLDRLRTAARFKSVLSVPGAVLH